jgi:hypothetical protein
VTHESHVSPAQVGTVANLIVRFITTPFVGKHSLRWIP